MSEEVAIERLKRLRQHEAASRMVDAINAVAFAVQRLQEHGRAPAYLRDALDFATRSADEYARLAKDAER